MKIININPNDDNIYIKDNIVATIGQFDGLHLGHMQLINKCLEIKNTKKLLSALITFNPRVDTVIKNDNINNYLLDEEIFISKLNDLKLDYLFVIKFNKELATIDHKHFLLNLINKLNIKELVVGFDFTYGYKGLGNTTTVFKDTNQIIKPIILDEFKINNQKVGTNLIKKYLKDGYLSLSNKLLGYNLVLKMEYKNNAFISNNLHLLKNQKYIVKINNEIFDAIKEDNYLKIINTVVSLENKYYNIEFIKES